SFGLGSLSEDLCRSSFPVHLLESWQGLGSPHREIPQALACAEALLLSRFSIFLHPGPACEQGGERKHLLSPRGRCRANLPAAGDRCPEERPVASRWRPRGPTLDHPRRPRRPCCWCDCLAAVLTPSSATAHEWLLAAVSRHFSEHR